MGLFKSLGKILGIGDPETRTEAETKATRKGRAVTTEQLDISEEGLQKIVADVLGGTEGLADIFSGEQLQGLYDTTAAAQAAGNLVTNLAGELAKLTAKHVTTVEEEEEALEKAKGRERGTGGGLLGALGGIAKIGKSVAGAP